MPHVNLSLCEVIIFLLWQGNFRRPLRRKQDFGINSFKKNRKNYNKPQNYCVNQEQDTDFEKGINPVVGDDPITFILEKYKNHLSTIAVNFFCHENGTMFWKKLNP